MAKKRKKKSEGKSAALRAHYESALKEGNSCLCQMDSGVQERLGVLLNGAPGEPPVSGKDLRNGTGVPLHEIQKIHASGQGRSNAVRRLKQFVSTQVLTREHS